MKSLHTDADLQNCICFNSNIEVWMFNEIDGIGVVQDFNDLCVKVNDWYYVRDNCTLKIV
jgi:hypothetical protein